MSKKPKTRSRKGDRELLLHTKRSMLDRYDHMLTDEQYAQLGTMIRAGQGTLTVRQTLTRTIWKLEPVWLKVPVYAVYQKPLSAVCTVLSEYMVRGMIERTAEEMDLEDAA